MVLLVYVRFIAFSYSLTLFFHNCVVVVFTGAVPVSVPDGSRVLGQSGVMMLSLCNTVSCIFWSEAISHIMTAAHDKDVQTLEGVFHVFRLLPFSKDSRFPGERKNENDFLVWNVWVLPGFSYLYFFYFFLIMSF